MFPSPFALSPYTGRKRVGGLKQLPLQVSSKQEMKNWGICTMVEKTGLLSALARKDGDNEDGKGKTYGKDPILESEQGAKTLDLNMWSAQVIDGEEKNIPGKRRIEIYCIFLHITHPRI